jgi:hypothetical protein
MCIGKLKEVCWFWASGAQIQNGFRCKTLHDRGYDTGAVIAAWNCWA